LGVSHWQGGKFKGGEQLATCETKKTKNCGEECDRVKKKKTDWNPVTGKPIGSGGKRICATSWAKKDPVRRMMSTQNLGKQKLERKIWSSCPVKGTGPELQVPKKNLQKQGEKRDNLGRRGEKIQGTRKVGKGAVTYPKNEASFLGKRLC